MQTATPHPVGVKKEKDDSSKDPHKHQFKVKFTQDDGKEYSIYCDQPRTVLEVIKTLTTYGNTITCPDENIIIQRGTGDNESSIAIHFPCSCIGDDEVLTILGESKAVIKSQHEWTRETYKKDKYSIFYIDKEGGKNTRTKELFKNNIVKRFKYLCVYGEKGITVADALKRDGRFIDDLGYFELSDNEKPNTVTECTQKVDNLDNKKFKICLPRQQKTKDANQQANHEVEINLQIKSDTKSAVAVAQQEGISVKRAVKETGSDDNTQEIYELLRDQFPHLKKLLKSRFPGDSFQEALNLRKENFGKIQQSFSEVHRVRKLLQLGKSVCKISVMDISVGTGFVLFDSFILTNAHLFKGYVKGKELQQDVDVFAIFDYEEPEPKTNFYFFSAENTFTDFDAELDYAVLELNPEGSKPNQQTKTKNIKVPPGLLSKFGPLPPSGEACIIGHPAGGVKKMDPTCIIEEEKRGQAIDEHLYQYKHMLIIQSISDWIRKQGIEDILMDGSKAGEVVTYHTFMYHGASGSPVFDGLGRVFGLHTAGFTYGFTKDVESVIEYAQPLIIIFERFVDNLKKNQNEELLKRVEEAAKGNSYLDKILKPEDTMGVSSSD